MGGYPLNRRGPYDPNMRVQRGNAAQAAEAEAVMVAPSTPELLGSRGFDVRLPGFNFPPAGTIPVDEIGDGAIAPGGIGTLVTVTVPDTFRLRVTGIGFHSNDDIALGYLTWAILVGPNVTPGYDLQQSAVGSIRQLSNIVVLAAASQTLTVRATIGATAPLTYTYACRLLGYFYSEIEQGSAR